MAMHVPTAPGFAQMMKEGAQHFSGIEEAVIRNINACVELSKTVQTTFGPNGQNKMIINHIDKLFVTSDAATILRELEVEHPAAKMLVFASHQQEKECGDGTNAVVIFVGALLENAAELIKMGLSVVEIADGYQIACKKALEILPTLQTKEVKDLSSFEEVFPVIRSSVMSKQYGNEDFLAELITKACQSVVSRTGSFNVDNIRVCKILGQGILSSRSVYGMLFKRPVEGNVRKIENARVVVYTCPLDMLQTETKGTVLIKNAQELLDYTKGEEEQVERHIKSIADTGVKVIVAGGKCGDLYIHYANKLTSKFDLRRLCKSINATPLPRLTAPTTDEMGFSDSVQLDEIGDTSIIIFDQEKKESCISTILLRGSTENVLDDIERCIDDGVNTFKSLTKDSHLVAGGGATEIQLAKEITSYGEKCPGLEQYAIQKFAESLESIPKAISVNTGHMGSEVIAKLMSDHEKGLKYSAVDIEAEMASTIDANECNIIDLFICKHWMIKFATQAAATVLKVDQIIMAKRAGGPKARGPTSNDPEDD